MSEPSRRSYFVELMSKAAGTWVAVAGGAALALLTACKYGGPDYPVRDLTTVHDAAGDDGPVVKYGGPPDAASLDGAIDGALDGALDGSDDGPVVKYGGPPDLSLPLDGPTTKYGGPMTG